jgi:hypothetical protein
MCNDRFEGLSYKSILIFLVFSTFSLEKYQNYSFFFPNIVHTQLAKTSTFIPLLFDKFSMHIWKVYLHNDIT